jgi:hypothetical protein
MLNKNLVGRTVAVVNELTDAELEDVTGGKRSSSGPSDAAFRTVAYASAQSDLRRKLSGGLAN